ncbi:hypothetical protein KUTeg_004858 [Tegillarca granosa]|uniref:DAGKc domain-containing protein n=1 Tax=Tegillarca granosa TaxID=220873 RepID=A0ABQ9FI36_TEGGR|nr:hypothetical protein KUTeg_004858 [Tegillarca granosa]
MKSHDISQKDGIILVGGDGTFYECINTLLKRNQMEAGISYNDLNAKLKPINTVFAQIPTGTLNGVSLLSTGQQDPMTSALHIIRGTTKSFGVTGLFSNGQLVSYYVLLCLVGAYADLFNALARRRFIMLIRMICTPIYHFLIKRQPSFDTEVLCYESETSKGAEAAATTISISEDVMKGVFCNMIIFAGDNTDGEFKVHKLHEGFQYDRTVMTAYERCSRMDLMGNFMKLVGGKPETVTGAIIDNIFK